MGTGQAWSSASSCHLSALCFCLAVGLLGPRLSEGHSGWEAVGVADGKEGPTLRGGAGSVPMTLAYSGLLPTLLC